MVEERVALQLPSAYQGIRWKDEQHLFKKTQMERLYLDMNHSELYNNIFKKKPGRITCGKDSQVAASFK